MSLINTPGMFTPCVLIYPKFPNTSITTVSVLYKWVHLLRVCA